MTVSDASSLQDRRFPIGPEVDKCGLASTQIAGRWPTGDLSEEQRGIGVFPDCRRPAAIAQIGITGDIHTNS